ncbi:MAG: hypothetical protein K2P86_07915, partial [Xanthobacteraceae bacterium]|nr:hypothetical protein [Xanthobacteraceae bacterium]
ARKKKAKPARKRAAKRRKALAQQSQTNWQIGAGVLALAVMIGAAIYAVSINDSARTSVANFVENFEVPQLPSLTNSSSSGATESAPRR